MRTSRCAERMATRCRPRYHTATDDAETADARFYTSIWRNSRSINASASTRNACT
jgi:hypothetical protein